MIHGCYMNVSVEGKQLVTDINHKCILRQLVLTGIGEAFIQFATSIWSEQFTCNYSGQITGKVALLYKVKMFIKTL